LGRNVVELLKQLAFAVFTVEPNGLLSSFTQHPLGYSAPLKLILFIENRWADEGGEKIISEIGFGGFHPGRSNHKVRPELPGRHYLTGTSMSEKQVAGIQTELCSLLHDLMKDRAYATPSRSGENKDHRHKKGWRDSSGSTLHHRFLPGPTIAVSKSDLALVRLFSELEILTPYFHWRLEQLGYQLNRISRSQKVSSVPRSSQEIRKLYGMPSLEAKVGPISFEYWALHDRFLEDRYWRPLLRPHVIGALSRHLRYAGEFLQFLAETGLLDPVGFRAAIKLIEDPIKPILDFRILPTEVQKPNHLSAKDGFPVCFYFGGSDYWTVKIAVTQEVWHDRRKIFQKPRGAENYDYGYPSDWDDV